MSHESGSEEHSLFIKTSNQLLIAAVFAFALPTASKAAQAQSNERSGKEVVEATCAACHKTGEHGAPRIGDKQAWGKRASKGFSSLTQNALKGIRQMPPQGANMALTDTEIKRAVAYMVNQSGGHWIEPTSKTAPPVERTGEQIVRAQCSKCHQKGLNGAPKIGDRDAWVPRLKDGLDPLVRSAINGHGSMPARGGLANLTDTELRSAIVYMFDKGVTSTKASVAPSSAPQANRKVVDGTEIYLGIVSAESMRAQHPQADAESKMHGGIPSGKGYYHLNISLFDSNSKAEIKDAQVEVRISTPLTGETKRLEPMVINNTVSYGNYFRMPGMDPYTVTVKIRRPDTSRTIEAEFDYKH
jgi:cytochrome c5